MIVDLFAGPGGWDEGLRMIGRTDVVGIEWDAAACATAEAAGHERILGDVSAIDPKGFGNVEGLIASPPCQAWSMAGKRKGEQDRANCHALADRMALGDDSIDWTSWEDERSALVCQPVRWVRELRPQWIALEEVPAVASLWEHFARIFRGWGYSVWTGDLCAADYGVPQTRTRRILVGHRFRSVCPAHPTHAEHPEMGISLFGDAPRKPWVSMASALSWGFDGEPAATISGGGGDTGGAEPFANAGYRRRLAETVLASRRDSPKWVAENGERENRTAVEPAPTITGEAHRWAWDRPATTVVGSYCPDVIAAPGYRTEVSRQNAEGSVRVTVSEAGVLQSFPHDYPWQGSKTKQFQQVGNAVPPLLAAHILAALDVGDLALEASA